MRHMDITQDPGPQAARAQIARTLMNYLAEDFGRVEEPPPRVRLAAVIRALADPARHDHLLSGHERGVLKTASLAAGEAQQGSSGWLPWATFANRAMGSVPGSTGGYAVGVQLGPFADALRGSSVVVASGAHVLEGLSTGVAIPRAVSGGSNAQWVAEGAAPSADDDPALGQASLAPRLVIAKTNVSEQLLRSPAAESAIRSMLINDVGEAIDVAACSGPGGAAPLGITRMPGVASVSGTSLAWSTIADMRKTLLDNGANEGDLFFLAAPDVQKILSAREKGTAGTGLPLIWSNGTIDGIRATATKHVPNGTLILGTASNLWIGSFGPGLEVAASNSSGFNTAQVALRVTARLDVTTPRPDGFIIATAVT
jgi:HK97 family phage major capsid protein